MVRPSENLEYDTWSIILAMKIFQVDAFTAEPFSGNPAAVCILEEPRGEAWMQKVAQEMNLSETAFLLPQEDGFGLRWFTPKIEVDLCGHATLASAHILWEIGRLASDEQAIFHTRSGVLTARQKEEDIEMDFPASSVEPVDEPMGLAEALGVTPKYHGKSASFHLLELEKERAVRRITPDFEKLRALPVRATIVTSKAESKEYDFVSRCFAPNEGIDEDPVTGSAHCVLGPYWGKRLGKNELMAYQASQRGGALRVHVEDDRVILGGRAVTIFSGEFASS